MHISRPREGTPDTRSRVRPRCPSIALVMFSAAAVMQLKCNLMGAGLPRRQLPDEITMCARLRLGDLVRGIAEIGGEGERRSGRGSRAMRDEGPRLRHVLLTPLAAENGLSYDSEVIAALTGATSSSAGQQSPLTPSCQRKGRGNCFGLC